MLLSYARIQEEIAAGNSVRASIKAGFSKACQCNLRWKHYNPDRITGTDVAWFRYC